MASLIWHLVGGGSISLTREILFGQTLEQLGRLSDAIIVAVVVIVVIVQALQDCSLVALLYGGPLQMEGPLLTR